MIRSEGFLDAKNLALKFSTLYALNKDSQIRVQGSIFRLWSMVYEGNTRIKMDCSSLSCLLP